MHQTDSFDGFSKSDLQFGSTHSLNLQQNHTGKQQVAAAQLEQGRSSGMGNDSRSKKLLLGRLDRVVEQARLVMQRAIVQLLVRLLKQDYQTCASPRPCARVNEKRCAYDACGATLRQL